MNLSAINKKYITAADLSRAMGIREGFAKTLLDNSVLLWTNRKYYVYRCPDCGKELKRTTKRDEIVGATVVCDGPHDEVLTWTIKSQDISVEYGE